MLPNPHALQETQESADVTSSEKVVMWSNYLGLKFHYKNTSISDPGFLWLLFSSVRSIFPPVLSINHPPSEPLAGVFNGMEPVPEGVHGVEPVVSLGSISGVLETESECPFRYKESRELFMWFAAWQKHDISMNYLKVLMGSWLPVNSTTHLLSQHFSQKTQGFTKRCFINKHLLFTNDVPPLHLKLMHQFINVK